MYLGGTSKKGFRFFAPCLGLAAINNIYKKKMDYYIIFRTKFFFYLENRLYITIPSYLFVLSDRKKLRPQRALLDHFRGWGCRRSFERELPLMQRQGPATLERGHQLSLLLKCSFARIWTLISSYSGNLSCLDPYSEGESIQGIS